MHFLISFFLFFFPFDLLVLHGMVLVWFGCIWAAFCVLHLLVCATVLWIGLGGMLLGNERGTVVFCRKGSERASMLHVVDDGQWMMDDG